MYITSCTLTCSVAGSQESSRPPGTAPFNFNFQTTIFARFSRIINNHNVSRHANHITKSDIGDCESIVVAMRGIFWRTHTLFRSSGKIMRNTGRVEKVGSWLHELIFCRTQPGCRFTKPKTYIFIHPCTAYRVWANHAICKFENSIGPTPSVDHWIWRG